MNHPKKQKGIILTSHVRKVRFRQVTWLFMSQSYQWAEPGFKARSDDSKPVLLPLCQYQLQIGTCHLLLYGLYHVLFQLLTSNILWKAFRVESRNEALCAQGKTSRVSLQLVRYFHELILWAKFLFLFISRKTLKSFMLTTIAHD